MDELLRADLDAEGLQDAQEPVAVSAASANEHVSVSSSRLSQMGRQEALHTSRARVSTAEAREKILGPLCILRLEQEALILPMGARCLLQPSPGPVRYSLLLLVGGYFAAGTFIDGECKRHKTAH